ncbi:helix-turn-helix transcriptional regulator [Paenibacillus arenilitoris]|uniref:WYL domain-containing protein n=1 Tax=Paenibacillus arenilitoris TaxID=2772299 RepID=A0A927CTI3_9BACL|nr:WYL domain-containing protein [Paenibacillus arenilitoris]MBD2871300.1 WYL domain-containing protein [Paenibacillus arenilitoris]
MAKWDNMLKIVWLLRSGTVMTAERLAEELETSVRTVYRYIDALCASGVPIIAEPGHDGGYSLPGTFKQAPLFFDPAELKAVLHAALFAQGAGYPFEDDLRRALDKIQLYHSGDQQEDWESRTRGMDVIPSEAHRALAPVLRQLERCVAEGLTVNVRYAKNPEDEPELRKLDPYGLAYRSNRWYAAAYCHLRQAVRTFRVDRFEGLALAGETFAIPDDFSAKAHFDQAASVQKAINDVNARLARIEGDDASLDRLAGHWYLRGCVLKRDAGSLELRIDEDTMLKHLPSLLLSCGPSVRAAEPPELVREVSKAARALAAIYGA